MNRIKVLVATSVVAIVALTTSVALAKPLSGAQWKQQANAVCKQVNKEINTIDHEVFAGLGRNEEPSNELKATFLARFEPAIEDAVTSIDALAEPKALKKDVKSFKAAVSKALTSLEADPATGFGGGTNPFAKVDKIAKRLGLKACAGG